MYSIVGYSRVPCGILQCSAAFCGTVMVQWSHPHPSSPSLPPFAYPSPRLPSNSPRSSAPRSARESRVFDGFLFSGGIPPLRNRSRLGSNPQTSSFLNKLCHLGVLYRNHSREERIDRCSGLASVGVRFEGSLRVTPIACSIT